MGTAPILLAWGDDLLLIEEAVAALGARMAAEDPMGGGLPEKVRLKAEGRSSEQAVSTLGELRRYRGALRWGVTRCCRRGRATWQNQGSARQPHRYPRQHGAWEWRCSS
jgi:hypothetical protein